MNNDDVLIDIECPICFEDLTNDDFLIDCCKKYIHTDCITKWYITHPNNKRCFICNQENNFCKNFINLNTTIDIIIDVNNNESQINYYNNLYLCKKLCMIFFTSFALIFIIIIC